MDSFEWTGNEIRARTADWYWSVVLIAIVGAAASVFFENYLFAVLIVVAAFSLIALAIRRPPASKYKISAEGIRIDDTLYPLSTLESFWIEDRLGVPKIIIVSQKKIVPYIVIPILNQDPKEVREFLLPRLHEAEHHEPLLHIIAERLGL
jgi:hypothetical protein